MGHRELCGGRALSRRGRYHPHPPAQSPSAWPPHGSHATSRLRRALRCLSRAHVLNRKVKQGTRGSVLASSHVTKNIKNPRPDEMSFNDLVHITQHILDPILPTWACAAPSAWKGTHGTGLDPASDSFITLPHVQGRPMPIPPGRLLGCPWPPSDHFLHACGPPFPLPYSPARAFSAVCLTGDLDTSQPPHFVLMRATLTASQVCTIRTNTAVGTSGLGLQALAGRSPWPHRLHRHRHTGTTCPWAAQHTGRSYCPVNQGETQTCTQHADCTGGGGAFSGFSQEGATVLGTHYFPS